jgi:hypothetical protein
VALSRASAAREGGGEASVGVVQAGLLSREISGSGCRRRPNGRKATSAAAFSRVVVGPRAVGEPGHVRRSPCARTGRSRGRPFGRWAGREGNAEAVSPRCTIVGSLTGA